MTHESRIHPFTNPHEVGHDSQPIRLPSMPRCGRESLP